MSVHAEGFTTQNGRLARWTLTDTVLDTQVGTREVLVENGGFDLVAGVEDGRTYRIDGYIDVDGDAVCHAGRDMVFTFDVAADALDQGVTFHIAPALNTGMWAGCRSFGAGDLTLTFDDFTPGRLLTVALIEPGPRVVTRVDTVTGTGDGSVSLPGTVLAGTFYELVAWVDEDSDQTCEASDKVWVVTTGAVGIPGSGLGLELAAGTTTDAAGCDKLPE